MGDITENFNRREFACKCGCGRDDINERLVHRLQMIRDITQVKMIIHSGVRCAEYNRRVGGAKNSFHVKGGAADWRFEHYIPWSYLLDNWSGGFRYYRDKGFFHTDIGPRRRW